MGDSPPGVVLRDNLIGITPLKDYDFEEYLGGRDPSCEIPMIEKMSSIWSYRNRTTQRDPKNLPSNLGFETPKSGSPEDDF